MVAEDASVSAMLSVRSSSADVPTDTNTGRISTDAKHVNVFQVDHLVTLRQIQPTCIYFLLRSKAGSLINIENQLRFVNYSQSVYADLCARSIVNMEWWWMNMDARFANVGSLIHVR